MANADELKTPHQSPPPPLPADRSLTICAVSTARQTPAGVGRLVKSLQINGYTDVRILGHGARWRNTTTKVNLFVAELKRMPRTQLVVAIDAYDVVAQQGAEALISAFDQITKQGQRGSVVLSAEFGGRPRIHFPLKRYFDARKGDVSRQTRFQHENGGFVMGQAQHLITMFEWALKHVVEINRSSHTVDQYGLGKYAAHFPDRVVLDVHQQLCGVLVGDEFQNFWSWQEESKVTAASQQGYWILRQPEIRDTGGTADTPEAEHVKFTKPMFLHVPGLSKARKQRIYDAIWKRLFPGIREDGDVTPSDQPRRRRHANRTGHGQALLSGLTPQGHVSMFA